MIMKKIKLFSTAFAVALMLGSCSTNDDVINGGGTEGAKTQYLTVNILDVQSTGSRAATNGAYEEGTSDENAVKNVRFYVFDSTGKAFNCDETGTKNYREYENLTDNGKDMDNVSSIKQAQIVIHSTTAEGPTQIVAVCNTTKIKDKLNDNMSLSELEKVVNSVAEDNISTNGIVMSNSTYLDGGKAIFATPIAATNIAYSEEDAKNVNPVNIYVERLLAKVRTTTSTESNIFKLEDTYSVGQDGTTNNVWVKVNGWSLGYENSQTNLIKQIDTSWTTEGLFGENSGISKWNETTNHRCYWATGVANDTPLSAPSWNNCNTSVGADNVKYTQENTSANEGKRTVILVSATLYKDENATQALELCRYHGYYYDGVESLKKQIAGELNTAGYRKEPTTDAPQTYPGFEPSDITFKTTTAANQTTLSSYQAVVVLTGKVYKAKGTDGVETDEQNNPKDVLSEANQFLAKNPAEIRTDGACYYFAEIGHYGTSVGVVRNHIYELNIKGFSGFGTPVYDKTETIVPVKPTDQEIYIAGAINVLSWRNVVKDINFTTK